MPMAARDHKPFTNRIITLLRLPVEKLAQKYEACQVRA